VIACPFDRPENQTNLRLGCTDGVAVCRFSAILPLRCVFAGVLHTVTSEAVFATNITQFPGAACDDKPVSVQPLAKTTDMESGSQFLWSGLDIDGDGKVAPGDVLGVFLHLLFLPGDFAIDLLIDLPVIARLLGIDANSYGGVASKTVSVLFWIATLILLGWIWSVIRDLDRAVTAGMSSSAGCE
jgi:hypothetical protein